VATQQSDDPPECGLDERAWVCSVLALHLGHFKDDFIQSIFERTK
jgi:hypothetical protein